MQGTKNLQDGFQYASGATLVLSIMKMKGLIQCFVPFCMSLETSQGRYSSLSSCVAELSACVRPNFFLKDILSRVLLQWTKLSIGSVAMSGGIKQLKEKKNVS